MQKFLLALVLITSASAFANQDNSMVESEFVSADQVAKYQDLPQTILLRVHKAYGNGMVEVLPLQKRYEQDSDLTAARIQQLLADPRARFEVMGPNSERAGVPQSLKTVKNARIKSLITDRGDRAQENDPESYVFGYRSRYQGRNSPLNRAFNAGYPYIRYASYVYTYLPYGPAIQVGDYIYAFYSWSHYYQ